MRILCFLAIALMTVSTAQAQEPVKEKVKEEPCKPAEVDYSEKPESLVRKYEQRQADIEGIDVDCNGILDSKEREAARKNKFKDADINNDGTITPIEAQAILGGVQKQNEEKETSELLTERRVKKMQSRLNTMDANEDGKISQSEYDDYYKARDEKLDRDGDGKLDITEYRTDTEHKKRSKSRDD